MTKPVRLTWRTGAGNVVVEDCLQIIEGDTLYIDEDEGVRLDGNFNPLSNDIDYVMFEDEHGLFGVPPADVIKIEPREEN